MNFFKLTKVTAILATSLFVTSSIFAAGVKEAGPTSTIAKIENIDSNANTYSFQVLSSTDEFNFTINNVDASSVYDLASYQVGDYIEIDGLTDGTANSIRYITPLVASGMIQFTAATPKIDVPVIDYGFNNNLEQSVNYSYGQLIEKNFIAQKTYVDASYFSRGILDATNTDTENQSQLYTMDEMQQIYKDYSAAVQADSTILPTVFGDDVNLAALKDLGTSDDMGQKFAYTYGYMFAVNFAQSGFPLNSEFLINGFLDAAFARDSQISEYQQQNAVRDFEAQFTAQQKAAAKTLAESNLKSANQFLATNKTNSDVVTLEDGLQYKILTPADGATPVKSDIVTVNYELSTPTGKVLDSSYQRGKPSQFPLSAVIPGFQEAVENMHVGETIIAWVHPDLGYGVDGNTSVEPNTLLTFKIELISIDQAMADDTASTTTK